LNELRLSKKVEPDLELHFLLGFAGNAESTHRIKRKNRRKISTTI